MNPLIPPPTSRGADRRARGAVASVRPGVAGIILLAGLTACTTSRSTREHFLERVPPPQPILSAKTTYGGGALTVEAWLGSSVRLRKPGEGPDHGNERSSGGRRSHRYAGTDATVGSMVENPFEETGEDETHYSREEIDEMYGKVNYQYILPPRLALTMRFANTSAHTLTVTLTDVNSTLGNFAPRPETLTLAPGQADNVDPMLSSFDNNFDELDVTLAVRLAGQTEQQVLHLRRSPETAPPPSAH